MSSKFNITNSNSVIGTSITWASMTNGFYNTHHNIYVYTNLQPR